jgi:arylsulfatase A-like enzyme
VTLVVSVVACGGPTPESIRVGDRPLVRLIVEEPQQLFDPSELTDSKEVEAWPFESGEWSLEADSSGSDAGGGSRTSTKRRVAWILKHQIDTDSIDVLELESTATKNLEVKLLWAREGEAFTRERSVVFSALPSSDPRSKRYRADLFRASEWRGVVARCRLVVRVAEGTDPQLKRLVGLRSTVMWSKLKKAQRSAWKAVLDHEARDAVIALPGTSNEYHLEVVADCELRIAYGSPVGSRQPVVFRAAVVDASGGENELFTHRVERETMSLGVWREARADLSAWRGQEIVVVLETDTDSAFDPARGVPLWANPQVVSLDGDSGDLPNLVLVSIDTLRADHMSLYGYESKTTPSIDTWSRDNATVFTTVVAPSPWTLPSHVSLFSGLDAFRHGINHDVGGIRPGTGPVVITALDMMAEKLRRAGYETAAFTGGAYLHPRFGFAQGFDRYAYWPSRRQDTHELETGVDRTLQWTAERSDLPFAVFLHTYAVHDPYRVRQPYFDRLAPEGVLAPDGRVALVSPENSAANGFQQRNRFVFRPHGRHQHELEMNDHERRMIRAMYDSGVAYTDAQIGRLLDGLSELGVADRTVVVITSDHGESLGERGQAGHIFLTDDNLLVPLIIAAPGGIGVGRMVEEQVRLIDVLPTVLELLGVETGSGMDGVSLVPLMKGEPSPVPPVAWSYSAAANRGFAMRVDGRLKYTINNTAWAPLIGRSQLFDLEVDPREIDNLAPDDPRTTEFFDAAMAEFNRSAVGLRLRIRSGDALLRGVIRGHAVRPVGTKAIRMVTPSVTSSKVGEAFLEAQPGSDFELHFEKVFGWKLKVEGELERGGESVAFRHTFDLRALGDVESLVFEDGRWYSEKRPMEKDEIGFSVFWHGRVVVGGPSAATADPELAEQLRALGYIE